MTSDGMGSTDRDQMAVGARHAALPSGAPFLADTSADLLRTIAEVLDIHSVFPRVSGIVKQELPHDALELSFRPPPRCSTACARKRPATAMQWLVPGQVFIIDIN
jgi:hypothetical protein